LSLPKSRKPDGHRQTILDYLHQEIIGPSDLSRGKSLRIDLETPTFDTPESAAGPWFDEITGQEILSGIRPKQRYGAGILYPLRFEESIEPDEEELSEGEPTPLPLGTVELEEESAVSFEELSQYDN